MKDSKDKFEKLRWVRAISPDIIPKYLVEQIKHREFTVEDFYKFQKMNCMLQGKEGMNINPLNHLYAVVDEENLVKGFLWFSVDPLGKNIFINNFSMDQEYWFGGKSVKMATEKVKELMKSGKIKKSYWLTRYPKHSERYGFKRAKDILMQYEEEEVCQA